MNTPTPPVSRSALSRPFRTAVVAVMVFGVAMQVLQVISVSLSERVLDSGVAPLQELLLLQRQTAKALQTVRHFDRKQAVQSTPENTEEICELPLLLQNMEASALRLLEGGGGIRGLPHSLALTGEARDTTIALRDRTLQLGRLGNPLALLQDGNLLEMQRGLLDIAGHANQIERHVLRRLQADFDHRRVLDVLATVATGALMAATLVALFSMWARVRSAFRRLHDSQAQLKAYTDAVPDAAFVLDSEGTVLQAMGRSMDWSDRPPAIPVGQRLQDHRSPALVAKYMQTIRETLCSHQVQTLETELESPGGERRWFEARVAEIDPRSAGESEDGGDGEDTPPRKQVIWLSRDVTARVETEQQLRRLNEELEQRVAERTRELNDAAEELRRFNYTVSHDLRAPLRAVEAFTALALEEAGESINTVSRDLLERSRKSAAQLSHMVESLLQLSRLGELPLQCAWLDLSAMVSEICTAFDIDQKGRVIEWNIAPGLSAWADEHLMRSVLQNLISNAVKYSAHRQVAAIEFAQVRLSDGSVAFSVRDNGSGFDMAQASQLFQPFTRLHSAKEFAGDGIGLATVRRIIMRHGGRIWAQGKVNIGATIFFTLPGPTAI